MLAISWKTRSYPVTSKVHLYDPEGVLEGCLKDTYFDRFRFHNRMICVGNRILCINLLSLVLICFHFSRYILKKKYFNSCGSSNVNILFSVRNWSEEVSWRDSEVYDPYAWECCKNWQIHSYIILEWNTDP